MQTEHADLSTDWRNKDTHRISQHPKRTGRPLRIRQIRKRLEKSSSNNPEYQLDPDEAQELVSELDNLEGRLEEFEESQDETLTSEYQNETC